MFRLIHHVTNKIRLLTSFTSLLMCGTVVQISEDLLCSSIANIMNLRETQILQNKIDLLQQLTQVTESKLKQLAEKLIKLGANEVDKHSNDVENTQNQLINLKKQLQENQGKIEDNETLQTTIYLLEDYIYLQYKDNYCITLGNLMSAFAQLETEENRYLKMSFMLKSQAEYIVAMDKYRNNAKQDRVGLKGHTNELEQEVTAMYDKIVQTHKENIENIEATCKYNEKRWFSLTIEDIKKLKKEQPGKLHLVHGVVLAHWNNIKHERDKILQELVKLLKLTPQEVDQYTNSITKAKEQLIALQKQGHLEDKELQEKISRLEYYIYLWHKAEYVISLDDVINVMIKQQEEYPILKISKMLIRQAEYSVEIDKYKNNKKEDRVGLKGHTNELKQEEEEVKDRYEQIVKTHKENIKDIEEKCKFRMKKWFSVTVEDIETLKADAPETLILAYWLVLALGTNIKHKRDKILQELKTSLNLSHQDLEQYSNIETAKKKLFDLKKQLQEKGGHAAEGLQKKIYLLEYYIYLLCKANYFSSLSMVMYNVSKTEIEEKIYTQMSIMLDRQAEYIVEMDKFKNNVQQYTEVLKDHINELEQEEKEVNDSYEQIVQTHTENIEYIEEKCKYSDKQWFSLTIEDMEKLKNNNKKTLLLIYGVVLARVTNIQHERDKILQELQTSLNLSNPDVEQYSNAITKAKKQLIDLKIQLKKVGNAQEKQELKKNIYLLECYLYLRHKANYFITLVNVMNDFIQQPTEENRYFNISMMLERQAEYIVAMDKFKNNIGKYNNVFTGQYFKLIQKEAAEMDNRYEQIVKTYQENIADIEVPFTKLNINAKQSLFGEINLIGLIDSLTQNTNILFVIRVLINNYNITHIQNKRDKILDILIALNVITDGDSLTIKQLKNKFNKYSKSDTKEKYILAYYIYLSAKYEYFNSLSNYILTLQKQNQQKEVIEQNKKQSEKKLKKYNEVKNKFTQQLSQYLEFIKANNMYKNLQQYIPTKEEIEDINLQATDKEYLEKLRDKDEQQHQEEQRRQKEQKCKAEVESLKNKIKEKSRQLAEHWGKQQEEKRKQAAKPQKKQEEELKEKQDALIEQERLEKEKLQAIADKEKEDKKSAELEKKQEEETISKEINTQQDQSEQVSKVDVGIPLQKDKQIPKVQQDENADTIQGSLLNEINLKESKTVPIKEFTDESLEVEHPIIQIGQEDDEAVRFHELEEAKKKALEQNQKVIIIGVSISFFVILVSVIYKIFQYRKKPKTKEKISITSK